MKFQIVAMDRKTGVTAVIQLESTGDWIPLCINDNTDGFLPDSILRVEFYDDEVGTGQFETRVVSGGTVRWHR